ncbi:MAG TPA: 2Fe-2S iron-sulfur cluster binding domain-containing protein [Symbiobacteriaceae bacterium]|nr:2Fe-2S iron-sulfur cluster binding domain-containing protein [Symbiobacteriaceae bacterium]
MRRIDYKGEEYLIHTRSGMRVYDALREHGIAAECDCDGRENSSSRCVVKWPKDTAFLLTTPTPFERKVLGEQLDQGYRLSCQAMFK